MTLLTPAQSRTNRGLPHDQRRSSCPTWDSPTTSTRKQLLKQIYKMTFVDSDGNGRLEARGYR